ncbi:MAG: M20 family metallo-hydrolase [Ginsengibacter sp.]
MKQEQQSLIDNQDISILQHEAIVLLKKLIAIPSFSREENITADIIENFLQSKNVRVERHLNNIWAKNKYYDKTKPTLLLNSHHDTVKPNSGYTTDPFLPLEKDGKLFGLGSNDAGGCLVSLIATFLYFYNKDNLQYNIVLAASAEEEISGAHGIESLLEQETFKALFNKSEQDNNGEDKNCAIVGEPTQMQMAVAEKGLLVLDCKAAGKAGHAARNEGQNAIYKAIADIEWIKNYHFEKVSDLLGPVKMSVTNIETVNKAHNVVPASCSFIVDIRVNELYTFEEIIKTIKSHIESEITPRSTRLRSSSISLDHPLVTAGLRLGRTYYGSPTTSDKALMNFPALKIGPGFSARSHSADEYIFVDEINEGIELYIKLLNQLL